MQLIKSNPSNIETKYENDLTLTWDYIGPQRTKGDTYYNANRFVWFECLIDIDDQYKNNSPVAVLCLSENMHLPFSLHISVFEVFKNLRGQGIGSIIMNDLTYYAQELEYRVITLQTRNNNLINFYSKFGYVYREINKIPILRKYIAF